MFVYRLGRHQTITGKRDGRYDVSQLQHALRQRKKEKTNRHLRSRTLLLMYVPQRGVPAVRAQRPSARRAPRRASRATTGSRLPKPPKQPGALAQSCPTPPHTRRRFFLSPKSLRSPFGQRGGRHSQENHVPLSAAPTGAHAPRSRLFFRPRPCKDMFDFVYSSRLLARRSAHRR
ncbi:hypothetical protein EVAR_2375_1 [Eumeta japonica]|uniref:Uncharacterized protein n=1 Tax=Eumeta variegata TaxID=151549 RepID=A0A4C1SG78_EUMVA|nr:hypothetical protein EVAR_2375_1 [Eumeta japonica]